MAKRCRINWRKNCHNCPNKVIHVLGDILLLELVVASNKLLNSVVDKIRKEEQFTTKTD